MRAASCRFSEGLFPSWRRTGETVPAEPAYDGTPSAATPVVYHMLGLFGKDESLVLTKDDGGISTVPGQTVVYSLTVRNVGNRDATGVVVAETVPANSTFNAAASLSICAAYGRNRPLSIHPIVAAFSPARRASSAFVQPCPSLSAVSVRTVPALFFVRCSS